MTARKKTARTIAAETLDKFYFTKKPGHIDKILDELITQTEQRQKATDLVFGCIKNCIAIDSVISRFGGLPADRIQPGITSIIRVAAYELIYCPATVEYAIVNEAVELVKSKTGKKQAAFTNAVLRQITRHIKDRQINLSKSEPYKTLPRTIEAGCQFDTAIVPDPGCRLDEYLSSAFSLPRWLIKVWLKDFGPEKTKQICFASNRRPGIYIRANTLRTTTAKLAEKFSNDNISLDICPDGRMLRLKGPAAVSKLPGFSGGLFVVQDPAATVPVQLLKPKQDSTILDVCAAPGTKTTQLAELTIDKAQIIATDIDAVRLEMVRENISRLGIKNTIVVEYDKLEQAANKFGPFDYILLDVPCSNSGVLARRADVRLRINPEAIEKLTKIQKGLLNFAADKTKAGGKICYSTCSIQSCENNELINDWLKENPTFKLEREKLTLPSAQDFGHDGGYAAIIGKS